MSKELDKNNIPKHIAIIMDGNGRWAQKRLMPRSYGHKKGVERIKGIVKGCIDYNVEALSLYALSTENFSRPKEELDGLFNLFREYFSKQFDELIERGVKLHILGDISIMPKDIIELIAKAEERSVNNNTIVLNIALNYGGQQEIVRAVNLIKEQNAEVDIESFNKYLYTCDSPKLDLIIRTGGEKRLSNFLLYQCAYAELYFSNEMWPDFNKKSLKEAILDFQSRNRRFGKVEKKS